jgi:hypothetical protein
MARDMQTPAAQKQVKLLPRWYTLAAQIEEITDQAARQALENDLQTARAQIDSVEETEEVAARFLESLAAKVAFLVDLQTIEEKLKSLPTSVQNQAGPLIESARTFLLKGEAEQAEATRRQIKELMLQAGRDTMMGLSDDLEEAWRSMMAWLSRPALPSPAQSQEAFDAATQRQSDPLRRFLAALSGLQLVSAGTRFWFFRHVLSVVLLVVLLLLGLQTLYIDAGATFGAGGLYDYLGLFLWGITADVAQRTLLNLGSPLGAKP